MKKIKKYITFFFLAGIILINLIANFQAYKFSHFTKAPDALEDSTPSKFKKLKSLITGIDNPRPVNTILPVQSYDTVYLESSEKLECWLINQEGSKGTVILFHGYCGEKSGMLKKSEIFLNNGYNVLLVDFIGSGGSEGNLTTIGFREAKDVIASIDFLKSKGEKKIILFGTSMGAVAIMKAIKDYQPEVKSLILECPFGSMRQTVINRFNNMNVPPFALAELLLFWGGVQNGFNTFKHNPAEYAKHIDIPTLLLWGQKDKKVIREEIDNVFLSLKGEKTLITFPNSGHDDYLEKSKEEWEKTITDYLGKM